MVRNLVDLVIIHGILDFQISLLHKKRNLLKLVIGIIRVTKHDAVEHFSKVGVEIHFNCASVVSRLSQLMLDAL